jgi:hypothetical protein
MNFFDDDDLVSSVHSFSNDDDNDDNDDDDDGLENDEQNILPFAYQTPPSWKLPHHKQVIKNAELICIYTLNALTEKGKGPVTLSEKDIADRILHLGLDIVVRAYTLYKQKFGENVALFLMSSLHSKESGVYVLERSNGDSKVG